MIEQLRTASLLQMFFRCDKDGTGKLNENELVDIARTLSIDPNVLAEIRNDLRKEEQEAGGGASPPLSSPTSTLTGGSSTATDGLGDFLSDTEGSGSVEGSPTAPAAAI